ncbi:MAG: TetR/AcrR family transcriptional regulator, partial [Myxococcota bacterium]
ARADPAERILRAASKLLTEEGPEALTNRRVAEEAGCTTMAIYSRYGSKSGVLEALFHEGLDRIGEAQRSVAADLDPRAAVEAMCVAFRRTALNYPGHYWLVFGPPPKDFHPSEAARQRARRAFEVLVAVVDRAVTAGRSDGDAERIAFELFAVSHGHTALGLVDLVPADATAEAMFLESIQRVLDACIGASDQGRSTAVMP